MTDIITPDFQICERVISGRWKLPILGELEIPLRFGDLQNRLEGLSRSVLAAQIQELLGMGLIHQKKYSCFPPRVEYSLTPQGRSLLEILESYALSAARE